MRSHVESDIDKSCVSEDTSYERKFDGESDGECAEEDKPADNGKLSLTEELFVFCLLFHVSGRAMDFLLNFSHDMTSEISPPLFYNGSL